MSVPYSLSNYQEITEAHTGAIQPFILPASFHGSVMDNLAPSLEVLIRKPTQQPKKGV